MSQPKLPAFQRVAPDEWKLSSQMSARRLDLLANGPGYCEIIDQVIQSATRVTYRRERLKADKRFSRLVATLSCESPVPVDLFHSSSAGYRAQYYVTPDLGERANSYAVAALSALIATEMRASPKRSCSSEWAGLSIHAPDAKVWIHQGRWLRTLAGNLRQLQVERWRGLPASASEQQRRAIYSQLTPWFENRIDFKGGFVSLDGELFGTLKPARSMQIFERGFT